MWPTGYWKQIITLANGEQSTTYFTTTNREEAIRASSDTSCCEITEKEYNEAKGI